MEGPRIEVELVSSDGTPEPAAIERPAPERLPSRFDGERGRLALAAGAALVIGAAMGWALGRTTDVDDARPPATGRTTVAPPTDPTAGEVLPEPERSDAPDTTRFRPIIATPGTRPTDAVTTVVSSFELPDRLAGVPAELLVTASRTRLFTLDLMAGELTERAVDRQPFGPPTMYAGDGWILLPSWDEDLESSLVRDGEPPILLDLGTAWELVGVAGDDAFWRIDDALATGGPGSVELIGNDGVLLGPTLDLPAYPVLADPAGGVVVDVAGDTYRIDPAGSTRLTTGELLAISATQVIVYECDDALQCAYQRVDRSTGDRSEVPVTDALGPDADLARPWWPLAGALISPDGEAVVTLSFDRDEERGFRETLGVLDLVTGAFVELAENRDTTPVVWAPDGAFVFYVAGGRLYAFDRAVGESIEVLPELVGVDALAIRPNTG